MHEAGLARSTLNRKVAAARAFTAWALRRGHLTEDPALRLRTGSRGTHLPTSSRPTTCTRSPTPWQLSASATPTYGKRAPANTRSPPATRPSSRPSTPQASACPS
ncbi:hypothetical protein [Nesterenkonia pannonica]|uniref:hypothetical protein n=1 Tax=Nesterenkonia pannonica TaxID=1548602 RepID=UPI002164C9EE|nr:hypothetical protein [Nesterenkonia pannonica]